MDQLFWIGFVGAAVAGLFAWLQAKKVLAYSEGTERMRKIASSIRAGANAYLKQQYTTVCKVFVVVFVILLLIAFGSGGAMLSKFTPFAFVTGGIFSMLSGFIGMKIGHQCQCPDGAGRLRKSQPGTAGGVFLRLRHGLYRGGSGHAGHHHLVFPAALCLRDG